MSKTSLDIAPWHLENRQCFFDGTQSLNLISVSRATRCAFFFILRPSEIMKMTSPWLWCVSGCGWMFALQFLEIGSFLRGTHPRYVRRFILESLKFSVLERMSDIPGRLGCKVSTNAYISYPYVYNPAFLVALPKVWQFFPPVLWKIDIDAKPPRSLRSAPGLLHLGKNRRNGLLG